MDDLFGDLVPKRKELSSPDASPPVNSGARDEHTSLTAFGSDGSSAASKANDACATTVTLGREELSQLLSSTVEVSVQASFAKFAKSLRTVLEDMGKRIDEGSGAALEVRGSLQELSAALSRQQEGSNARFTSIDMAVR